MAHILGMLCELEFLSYDLEIPNEHELLNSCTICCCLGSWARLMLHIIRLAELSYWQNHCSALSSAFKFDNLLMIDLPFFSISLIVIYDI